MSYLTATDAWIVIVRHVYGAFDAETFNQWLCLVGQGDDFDRCCKGEQFYKLLGGETAVSPIIEVPYERPGLQVQPEKES